MKKAFFLIGNAHLDPVWQWRVPQGLSLVKSTFLSALERMKEYPGYVFTAACASYYKWIKCSEPELFESIRQRIRSKSWCVTGGMWVQPDCNIPCGESFCRHLLYSQRFFKENFGQTVKTGYNVDSFGHNGMMPQLLRKSGIENYVYMRPNDYAEKAYPFAENLHFWRGCDGSEVLCFRIPDNTGGYTCTRIEQKYHKLQALSQPQMLFYGIGNHGGGAARQHLEDIETLKRENPDDDIRYAGVDDYFDYVRSSGELSQLPVLTGDLQHHASGCYAANAKIKQLNRRAENELICAEKIAVLSALLTRGDACRERIAQAWERVMFCQFHDILAGCSIKPAYDDAYNSLGYARTAALETGTYAAERISWRINTTKFFERESIMRDRLWVRQGEGSPVVVFNPHSFPVRTCVTFGTGRVSGVSDSDDRDVPFQLIRAPYTDGDHKTQCLLRAEIPAYGWNVYYIWKDDQNYTPIERKKEFTVGDMLLENRYLRLRFDKKTGGICSFYDKETGTEYAAGNMASAVICDDEKNDTWGHLVKDYNLECGAFALTDYRVTEQGVLAVTAKVTSRYESSVLTQYFTLYRGEKKVHVRVQLDFRQKHRLCKLCFPVQVDSPKAYYALPFGYIRKEADGLEQPCGKWAALTEDGEKGFAVINDCKHSFCAKENELRFIAARCCAYLDHYAQSYRDEEMEYIDYGQQEFSYVLMPVQGDLMPVIRAAQLLNMPCALVHETHHQGTLPPCYSAMSVMSSRESILAESIKESEDGSGIIVRAIECAGEVADASICFTPLQASYHAIWHPFEVKTVLFPSHGSPREVLITEYEENGDKING